MPERGLFIVLEGIDNCGKTTQAALLAKYLEEKGLPVLQTREPGGTEVGEEIRQVLLKPREQMMDPVTQLLLFNAARREFLQQVVKPAQEGGVHVITDRFDPSTYAYQVRAQGVSEELFYSLRRFVISNTDPTVFWYPDLCIILDIPAEESKRRENNLDNKGQQLIYEMQGLEFANKVREGYKRYVEEYLQQGRNSFTYDAKNTVLLDGMKTVDVIHRDIVHLVEKKLREREEENL